MNASSDEVAVVRVNACLQAPSQIPVADLLGYMLFDMDYEDSTLCGLRNAGNTCYLDALLCVLAKVPSVRTWLLGHQQLALRDENHQDECLLCALALDIARLTTTPYHEPFVPQVVLHRGSWYGPFNNHRQHDAHEAFCALLDQCEAIDAQRLLQLNLEEVHQNQGCNATRYSTFLVCFWRSAIVNYYMFQMSSRFREV